MFKLKINRLLSPHKFKDFHLYNCSEKLKLVSYAVIQHRNNQTESENKTQDVVEDTSVEEEIEKKRNKNRLPERVYRQFVKKEVLDIELKQDFFPNRLRRQYGRYGKATKLNPGILYPTKDLLDGIIEFEEKYNPPLQQMLETVKLAKAEREKEKKEYEALVYKNLANLDKTMQDYYGKLAKKQAAADELKKKRELLIEEISEYLGYDVDPQDPKFKEAVESRQKEKKKAMKEKKQKESYEKMLQRLSEIAESSKKD